MTLKFEDLILIRAVLEKGWNGHTSYLLGEHDGYPKSLGQCYVTARALHHVFGWEILFNGQDGNNHYWNRLPCGLEVDFTSDQLGGDGVYPAHEMLGKPRRFKPLQDCKTINPRLRLYLQQIEAPLRILKKELDGKHSASVSE